MAKEEMKYEQAVRELEQIVERMENDELDIDQLSEQLKRAKTLVKLCKDKLTKTDEEIKKLLSEDWFPLSPVSADPACFGGFAIRRQLPISDLQSASSNGARTKKYQFRRISNPQRNRSNLFCLRISNPQERLRRIEAPACFGGFAIRRRTGNYFGFAIRFK